MRSRWRDLLGTLGLAGALLTLAAPRWQLWLHRLATALGPSVGRRYGLAPRSAFLFAVGRLLGAPERARSHSSPTLFRLLAEGVAQALGVSLPGEVAGVFALAATEVAVPPKLGRMVSAARV